MKLHIQLLLAFLAIGCSYSQLLHVPIMHFPVEENSHMHNLVNLRGSVLPNGPLTYGPQTFYCAQFQIGSQKAPVNMLIDTGSTTIWVPAPGTNYSANTFNCSASSTCNLTSTPISKTYGTSSATTSGYNFYDDLTFAGATLHKFPMAVMNTVASSNGCDGIAGQDGNDLTGAGTLAVEFHKAGITSSSTFSVYLGKNPTGQKLPAGQLTYGGYNPALTDGNFIFLPKMDRKWNTPFNSMRLGNTNIPYSLALKPYVSFDTGDLTMSVPADWLAAIANAVNGISYAGACTLNSQINKYQCDCGIQNSLPSLFFYLGGYANPFELPVADYFVQTGGKCQLNFSIFTTSLNDINLGTPFLKHYYLMFSWDNSTIGFGNISQNAPTTFSL